MTGLEAFFGLVGIGFAAFWGLAALWYLLQVIAYWRIFQKAGKPGWHSIIPLLNTYDQYDLSWRGFWGVTLIGIAVALWLLTPGNVPAAGMETLVYVLTLAAAVIEIIGAYKLSKAFGHGVLFALGLIFFTPIFMLILGFGASRYHGRQ